MQKINYLQLIPSDYIDYRNTWLNCLNQYPDYFGATLDEGLDLKSLKLANAILNPDEYNFAFGAFADERLIGMCGFITDMRQKARHRGEIVQLFVDSNYRGNGIGKKLLQLTIEKAFANGKTEQIILSAATGNENAIRLYQQSGFMEYGKLDHFFKSGKEYFSQSFFYLMKPEKVQV